MNYTILNRDELPRDKSTFEFEGFQHQNTEVSFIWVDMPPGGIVRLHKHPYKEIFIIQEGISTFTVGFHDTGSSCRTDHYCPCGCASQIHE